MTPIDTTTAVVASMIQPIIISQALPVSIGTPFAHAVSGAELVQGYATTDIAGITTNVPITLDPISVAEQNIMLGTATAAEKQIADDARQMRAEIRAGFG